MDKRIFKLMHKGYTKADAEKLVAAGLSTPKLIKSATEQQLKDLGVDTKVIKARIG